MCNVHLCSLRLLSIDFSTKLLNLEKFLLSFEQYRIYIYVTGKMDLLGKTVLPRQNGFAGRKNRFARIDQAKWIWNCFWSYLFV